MQPVRNRSTARRATAGLAVVNSREHNNAEGLPHEGSECFGHGCFLAGPKGASQIGQCRVAVLVKGMPFPADCALPWPIWDALHPSILSCSTTSDLLRASPRFPRKRETRCSWCVRKTGGFAPNPGAVCHLLQSVLILPRETRNTFHAPW